MSTIFRKLTDTKEKKLANGTKGTAISTNLNMKNALQTSFFVNLFLGKQTS